MVEPGQTGIRKIVAAEGNAENWLKWQEFVCAVKCQLRYHNSCSPGST